MQILTIPEELAAQCRVWHRAADDIALIPTMGYYHAGHEDLIRHGRKLAKRLVVSLFVNPTQFGPNEDLAAYPRDIESDCAKAKAIGADAIFIPEPSAMYAANHATWVEVPDLAARLCGKSRPIHFRGVCTVVLKLMLLTGADYAVFGQKDWQQQAIIRRMVRDLNVPCAIITRPTVREDDGLALSSRNVYLTSEERKQAPHIRKGLLLAREMVSGGELTQQKLIGAVLDYWKTNMPNGEVDYIEIVDPESLEPLNDLSGSGLLACAVKLGKARLIDNIELKKGYTDA